MNGVHDMGGMHGMGPIEREDDEPVFHREWEARVLAMTVASGFLGRWNIDMSRHAREQMPAAEYLATSYYEHWLSGLELLLARSGFLEPNEIEERMARARAIRSGASPTATPAAPPSGVRVLRADDVLAALRAPGGARVAASAPGRFRAGDRVRARTMNPVGHTRLPRYARGRHGVIDCDHGVWVFPDSHAAGQGAAAQHLYGVRFAARELWGPEAAAGDAVILDLWDDYLEPAEVTP